MSSLSFDYAWKLRIRPDLRLTMLGICDSHFDGEVHFSIERLADFLTYDVEQTETLILELVDMGLLSSPRLVGDLWCVDIPGIPPRPVHQGKPQRKIIPRKLSKAVFARDGRKCVYCGDDSGPFQLDHVVPVIKGGENSLENLSVSCKTCNIQKRDKSAEDFLAWKAMQ